MPETLEFLSIDFWQTFMAIGNLLILFFIIKKYLFKPVNELLDKRKLEVDKIYSDAKDMKAKAIEDKAIYEEKLKEVKSETDLMIKNATKRAQNRKEEILNEASIEVDNRKRKAEEDIILAKKKAVDEMKDNIVEMVIDVATLVVEKEVDAQTHEALIDSAIANLGNAYE